MIRGLESVLIGSQNAKKLADFYNKIVGLKKGLEMVNDETGETGYELKTGTIGLYVMDHSKVKGKSKNPERVFFNLEVDDVKKEVKRLKKAKVKQIAGLYLGKQMKLIATRLAENGLILPFPIESITSTTISQLLQLETIDQGSVTVVLRRAAQHLRDRSAQILGVMIATAIKTFPDQFPENTIKIPIEGSLFWNVPGYVDKAREVSERLSQKRVEFLNIENAGRIGAAVAALSFVRKQG